MTSLVARVRGNLVAKFVLLVFATEALLLAALGGYWLREHERETHERLAAKMALPAALMSQLALGFDAAGDLRALEGIVQERVVDAFVARRTGDVYFAADPAKVGRPYTDFTGGAATGRAVAGGRIWHTGAGAARNLAFLAPLRSGDDEIGHLYLEIDAPQAVARDRRDQFVVLAGAAVAVSLTLLITGFWAHRLLVPRIDRTIEVLEEVSAGRYSTRASGPGALDQIGRLMLSVDDMIERIDAHTASLRALAQAGREFAAAGSRADIQRALVAAVGGWLRAEPAGTFDLRLGEDPRLSAYQRDLVAAGEVLLVGDPAGVPGPGPARVYAPVVDRPASREAVWFGIDPAARRFGAGSEFFLRTLSGLLIDALGRADALERLREAEREYRDLFDNAVEGIFRLAPDGVLLAANPALVRMLGFSSPADLAAYFSAPPESRWVDLKQRDEFLALIRDRGEVHDFEVCLRRRDGTTLWASLSGRAVRGADGGIASFEGSLVDASERRRREAAEVERRATEVAHRKTSGLLDILALKNRQLEETFLELQGAQARLVRTEKMAAMGTMAAGVAHDLNNILSGIVGYPDLLLLDLPPESPLRASVEAIRESGTRAAAVVADLLTLARGAAYAVEECDLGELVERYLGSPEHQALAAGHPRVRVVTRLAPERLQARCSRVHMQKVVMNLVMNALEAIRDAGEVTIRTERRALAAGEAGAAGVPPGDYVALVVEDDGPGIPDADLARVFEPFFSKKVLGRSGTGLGLTVVLNTVLEHGGCVIPRSGPAGASFTVLLPAAGGAPRVKEPGADAAGMAPSGSGVVLVVDDERQLRELATRMLGALGYTAAAVPSGEAAVAWLRERPADLVLLDMLMPPGMNGCETYREILRVRPGQKALICSGFSQSGDYEEARRLGAGRFLKKPFSLAELGQAVRRELEGEQPAGAG